MKLFSLSLFFALSAVRVVALSVVCSLLWLFSVLVPVSPRPRRSYHHHQHYCHHQQAHAIRRGQQATAPEQTPAFELQKYHFGPNTPATPFSPLYDRSLAIKCAPFYSSVPFPYWSEKEACASAQPVTVTVTSQQSFKLYSSFFLPLLPPVCQCWLWMCVFHQLCM